MLIVDGERLSNLRFADDLVLISDSADAMVSMIEDKSGVSKSGPQNEL